jgi:hypothetical protein
LIAENNNETSNCAFRKELTRFYDEPFQFWEGSIDIEKYIYPRFTAYERLDQIKEKEKPKKVSARNNKQPRRAMIKRTAKASTSK